MCKILGFNKDLNANETSKITWQWELQMSGENPPCDISSLNPSMYLFKCRPKMKCLVRLCFLISSQVWWIKVEKKWTLSLGVAVPLPSSLFGSLQTSSTPCRLPSLLLGSIAVSAILSPHTTFRDFKIFVCLLKLCFINVPISPFLTYKQLLLNSMTLFAFIREENCKNHEATWGLYPPSLHQVKKKMWKTTKIST